VRKAWPQSGRLRACPSEELLGQERVTQAVMESTGVVLKPVWYALEDAVDELVLVNARQVKKVPGCKTDVRLAFAVASSCEVVVSSTCNASRWLVVFPKVDSTDDNFPTVSARCTRVTCSDERAWRNSDRKVQVRDDSKTQQARPHNRAHEKDDASRSTRLRSSRLVVWGPRSVIWPGGPPGAPARSPLNV